MKTNSSSLREECEIRGIPLDPVKKHTRRYLLSLLTQHAFRNQENPSYGLTSRVSFESPMLCASFHDLSEKDQFTIMHSEDWIAEPKYYGCRCITTYHPEEGFKFFSRSISPETFLPVEYTENILIPCPGKTLPGSWKNVYNQPFVLDGELYSQNGAKKKSTRDSYYTLEGNYVSFLMQLPPEESHKIQMEDFSIRYTAFDLLYLGRHPVWSDSLRTRKSLLDSLVTGGIFSQAPLPPFNKAPFVSGKKIGFLREQIDTGMEGCVLKNLTKPYLPSQKRDPNTMVRIKPRSDSVIEDLDVFITSVSDNFLNVSVFLRNSFGFEEEISVGAVAIPKRRLELRQPQFPQGFFHRPVPNSNVVGRVLTVKATGYDMVHRRFNHLQADWDTGFRSDKSPMDCVLDPSSIESRWLKKVM